MGVGLSERLRCRTRCRSSASGSGQPSAGARALSRREDGPLRFSWAARRGYKRSFANAERELLWLKAPGRRLFGLPRRIMPRTLGTADLGWLHSRRFYPNAVQPPLMAYSSKTGCGIWWPAVKVSHWLASSRPFPIFRSRSPRFGAHSQYAAVLQWEERHGPDAASPALSELILC